MTILPLGTEDKNNLRKMRSFLIILLLLLSTGFCFSQSTKEEKFKTTIQEIITGFSKLDSIAVSKHINKEIGVYQLIRAGVFDQYDHFKAVSFSDTTYSRVLFRLSKGLRLFPLKYASLPTYNCEKEAWTKKGLFVDTTNSNHLVSEICKMRNKFVPDHIPNKKIEFFYELENKSRQVILNDSNGLALVFYVSYLNGKWYLTIVDYVSSDCSA
jgi:hypothetical protein